MHTYQHISGLSVTVIPKPRFSRKFAGVVVPYGSVHTQFRDVKHPHEIIEVPPGTAHFLEHCLFSGKTTQSGELIRRFAALGVEADAYTDYGHTMFYVLGTDHFGEACKLLLSTLIEPTIGDCDLDLQREVVQSELNYLQSDSQYLGYERLMKNMFKNHSCRYNVNGTLDSIGLITKDHLAAVHRNFYTPRGFSIVLAGGFDEPFVESFLELINDFVPNNNREPLGEYISPVEPRGTSRFTDSIVAPHLQDSYILGFKDPKVNGSSHISGANLMIRRIAGQLLLDVIVGKTTFLYEELYNLGAVNERFHYSYHLENDCSYVLVGGVCQEPDRAAEVVYNRIIDTLRGGKLDEDQFQMKKRVAMGSFIRSMDNIMTVGMNAAICRLNNIDLFDYSSAFTRIDLSDTIEHMNFMLDSEAATRVIVN